MNDYFSDVRSELRRAVDRRAHLPWYRRRPRSVRSRALIVVIAALVVATPAVGAVTNWFGIGALNHPQSDAQAFGVGNAIRGTTKLLPLRVADPQGGPPWGIRVVTTKTGACQEIGRVEDGRLGSLGIDDYWHNDHLFHPYPRNWVGQSCGSTGPAVDGVQLGVGATQFYAGANVATFHNSVQLTGCSTGAASESPRPPCPPGSGRFVIWGLLGPKVKSIRYELPNRSLATERTAGRYGEFLLVFPLNADTCRRYLHGNLTKGSHCARTPTRSVRPFFTPFAAIKAITFRSGQTCPIRGPGLLASAVCPKPTDQTPPDWRHNAPRVATVENSRRRRAIRPAVGFQGYGVSSTGAQCPEREHTSADHDRVSAFADGKALSAASSRRAVVKQSLATGSSGLNSRTRVYSRTCSAAVNERGLPSSDANRAAGVTLGCATIASASASRLGLLNSMTQGRSGSEIE